MARVRKPGRPQRTGSSGRPGPDIFSGRTPRDSSTMEERLSDLEARIEAGLGSLEDRVARALGERDSTDEVVTAQIHKALEDFEERVREQLRQARNAQAHERSDLLDLVLNALGGVRELAKAQRYKELWGQYWMRGRSEVVDDYGLDPVFERRFKPLFDFLFYEYWRVEVRGMENVPESGPALLTSNHSGALPYDGAMVKIAVVNEHPRQREVRFLVENFAYHFPYMGTFLHRVGGVRACPENAVRLLKHGELVAVFPEGVKGLGKLFKHRYQLQRFGRGGFIRICLQTKAPLVPVAIVGAEEIHPMIGKASWLAGMLGTPYLPITPTFPWLGMLGMIPLPTKWTIQFGKPWDFSHYPASAINNGTLINKLSQGVRAEIQDMIVQRLRDRRSIWTG